MKLRITQTYIQNIIKIGLFICLIFAIVQFFPRTNDFNYQFEVGKPWSYELITSSFDFPIYKSNKQITQEQDELLKKFIPYYVMDSSVCTDQANKMNEKFKSSEIFDPVLEKFLFREMQKIYATGIVSIEAHNKLVQDKKNEIHCIMPDRITNTKLLSEIYTPKTAYEKILRDAPEYTDQIKLLNLNLYLIENLEYDKTTSELSKKDLLKNLSLTNGMIQSGERIIGKGEIVTPSLYQILNSLKLAYEKRETTTRQSTITLIGEILVILVLVTLLFLYIYIFRPRIYDSFSNLLFIVLMVLLIVGMATSVIRFSDINYYIVPYALLPIIIRVFFDSRTALFAHIITTLIISFITDNPFQFVILQITVGMAAVSNMKDLTQRSQLTQTAFYIFICYSVVYLGLECIANGEISTLNWKPILYLGISSGFLLFAYVLIYLFEKSFGLISSVTLVELTNINSGLMMKFAEVAPGSFQHSLQVSNLATEAAKKISANSLLVRTGALYHDIGKMNNPGFFTENQAGGKSPLLKMDFEEAAGIIIDHVSDGIQIAKKNHLPEQIICFISTHHGTSKTKYFYNSFINANPGTRPNENAFTYPGPTPNSKETAILMMADAVEARSRSLAEYTEENIDFMVDDMINSQIADGQFKDAPISFQDVEIVKSVFKQKIKNIYHTRITYPEAKIEMQSVENTLKETERHKEN